MNDTLINEGVQEVLARHLHTTEDEELQAALWQVLGNHDDLVRRLLLVGEALS